jgi:uncharacterized membrane protein
VLEYLIFQDVQYSIVLRLSTNLIIILKSVRFKVDIYIYYSLFHFTLLLPFNIPVLDTGLRRLQFNKLTIPMLTQKPVSLKLMGHDQPK